MRVLWKDERRKFLAALGQLPARHRKRNRALMMVAYDTGCRVAELCALDVGDYDDQRRSVHVINVKAEGHPKREIPLHATTARSIRAWLAIRPSSESPALFISQKGTRICDRQARKIYDQVCKIAGIDGQGIHTLRHTMATRLLDERVLDIHQVSRRLGHRSIQTTYRYYVHGSVEEEAQAIHNHRL